MFARIARLHRDERGNESIQTVLIMAVGALVLLAIHSLYKSDIGKQVQKLVQDVLKPDSIVPK